jgi:hypothetical protein
MSGFWLCFDASTGAEFKKQDFDIAHRRGARAIGRRNML